MFTLMKNTIDSGNYKFLDLQQRIARLYAMGNISEDELNDLMTMAVEKANPETERPEVLILIQTLSKKVESLTSCVEALTARVKALESGDTSGGTDEGDTDEYPAWEPWDGLSNKYQPGAIVSHGDELWESVYSGQNVWEPGVVDERFWIHYTPEE